MKTMKLIDIWERIIRGEQPPKQILIMGTVLTYDEDLKSYIDKIERQPIDRIFNLWVVFKDKVEIIEDISEEDKKIEKLYFSVYDYNHNEEHTLKQIENKFNEIIDKINGE